MQNRSAQNPQTSGFISRIRFFIHLLIHTKGNQEEMKDSDMYHMSYMFICTDKKK